MKFPRLLTIELNSFDVDLLLPALFFRILANGKQRARVVNKPERIAEFVEALSNHSALEGFQGSDSLRVLDRLVRTELITVGKVGRGHRGEQILTVAPYTILTHKTGFPRESSRVRGVDTFLYKVLRDVNMADEPLRQHFKTVFGQGVIVNPVPDLGGSYDGKTELDTLTRLAIAFLDGFEAVRVGLREAASADPACPAVATEMGWDLLRYVYGYADCMPPQALTTSFIALINFELFIYTLKLVTAVNALVHSPDELPPAMREKAASSAPQIYVDFTAGADALSKRMATECVRRDIESYQRYMPSSLLLRQLDRYVKRLRHVPQRRAQLDAALDGETSGPLYFQSLLLLRENPSIWAQIEASAQLDEDEIRQANRPPDNEDSVSSEPDWLDDIGQDAESDVDRVVELVLAGQNTHTLANSFQWYRAVGGLTKPYGLLAGNLKGRQSWRYAPSNDLLAVWVQLAAIRIGNGVSASGGGNQQTTDLKPIGLRYFLHFLSERFGILVDRPPEPFEGAEYTAAARENLRAMLRRLRQMGIFGDLSDDFTVQHLTPPYAKASGPTRLEGK
ncbi:MAG TPA: hypothetical protein VGF38_18570 [Ktedonobacterales bacterium]